MTANPGRNPGRNPRRKPRWGAIVAGALGLCVGVGAAWVHRTNARTEPLGCTVSCCMRGADESCDAYYYSSSYRHDMDEIRQLVAALPELRPGDAAADIGCGQGFVTFESAARVGPTGQVWAIDIDPRAVASVAHQAEERHVAQVHAVRVDDPRKTGLEALSPGSLRALFLINSVNFTSAEAADVAYLERLRSLLAPGGTLVYHVDWIDDVLLDETRAMALFQRAGFPAPLRLPVPSDMPERSCYCAGGWTPKAVRRGYLLAFTMPR